jgi:hypothetical protein
MIMIMIMIQRTKLPGLRKQAFSYAKTKEQDKKTHKIKNNREVANSGRRTPAARELGGDQIHLKFGNFVRFFATNDLPIPCVEGIHVCVMRGLPTRAHCRSSSSCASDAREVRVTTRGMHAGQHIAQFHSGGEIQKEPTCAHLTRKYKGALHKANSST